MRFHRLKLVRKHLRFYRIVYGIEDPYDIILDGNFIFTALEHKVDIRDRLRNLLQGSELRLYITKSAIKELESIGVKGEKALEFATKFCIIIDDKPTTSSTTAECILNLIQSKSSGSRKYFVATQDKDLRISLSKIPGVPTIYFNKVILVLEAPSASSHAGHSQIEKKKTSAKTTELEVIDKISHSETHRNSSNPNTIMNTNNTLSSVSPTASSTSRTQTGAHVVTGRHSSSGGGGDRPSQQQLTQRRKHKAKSSNPLASMKAQQGSKSSNKKKNEKFKH